MGGCTRQALAGCGRGAQAAHRDLWQALGQVLHGRQERGVGREGGDMSAKWLCSREGVANHRSAGSSWVMV
jgi:hypothetical protein